MSFITNLQTALPLIIHIKKNRLTTNPPTVKDWTKVIQEIFKIERITFLLKQEQDKF